MNFKGSNEDLLGHVYTYGGYPNASQIQNTTEKIGHWVKQNCSNFPLDIWKGINTLEKPDQSDWRPIATENMDDTAEATTFKDEGQEYGKRKLAFHGNSTNIYTVIIGQCSEATQAELEARNDRGCYSG